MIRPKPGIDHLFSDCLMVFNARFYCPQPDDLARFESLVGQKYLRRETQGKIHGYAIALLGIQLIEASHGHAQTD